MKEQHYQLRGLDPLLFRDGRAFGTDPLQRGARTLPVPAPPTIAGLIRSRLGSVSGWDWAGDGPDLAMKTEVHGPILLRDGTPIFAAPADAVVPRDGGTVMPLRPTAKPGTWCNLPAGLLPLSVTADAKPATDFAFWKQTDMFTWLLNASGDKSTLPERIPPLPQEIRIHVSIDPVTGKAADSRLFSTSSLVFESEATRNSDAVKFHTYYFAVRVKHAASADLRGPALMGGERRVGVIEHQADLENSFWKTPDEIVRALKGSKYIRMVLATPAVFTNGWKPGWLGDDNSGFVPGVDGVQLKLVAAAVPRKLAISGWDLKAKRSKPVRWMAPAGAVYFFELLEGDGADLTTGAWLQPVSDDVQDRRDGCGLALWGLWA